MTDGKNETALMLRADNTALRNKTFQVTAIQRAEAGGPPTMYSTSARDVIRGKVAV